ncbi:MAG: hypothetical protein ABIT71_19100 [Vicinamibacteraceae bacterium]
MDPLQNDIWQHLGHVPDASELLDAPPPAASMAPDVTGVAAQDAPASTAAPSTVDPEEQRVTDATRRRFDRGGRRRADWPDDAGMTGCPACGFESIQSLGMLDSGDYLWQCPQCDRRFQTGRATRTLL